MLLRRRIGPGPQNALFMQPSGPDLIAPAPRDGEDARRVPPMPCLVRKDHSVDDVDHAVGRHDVRLCDFGVVNHHSGALDANFQ